MYNSRIFAEPAQTKEEEFQTSSVLTIISGHAIHDGYQAFLSPLLPVLIKNLSLSITQAGFLSSLMQIPSLIQPFVGYLADRRDLRWIVILAPAVTGVAMSLIGIAPAFSLLAMLLLAAGISSALYHSVAPVMTGALSGNKLGRGMSYWMVGGELGRTLGPVIIVSAIKYVPASSLPLVMIAGLLTSSILYLRLRDTDYKPANQGQKVDLAAVLRRMTPLLTPLLVILIARSFVSTGLTTYLPLFLTEAGASLWFAGASLSIMEAAGVVGAMLGGEISDRLGRRKVMVVSIFTTSILLFLFTLAEGWVRLLILPLLGFASLAINPVIMALVQENFPENRALANGFYMLINFGVNAVAVVLVGVLGDRIGLHNAYYTSAGILMLGLLAIPLLPKKEIS